VPVPSQGLKLKLHQSMKHTTIQPSSFPEAIFKLETNNPTQKQQFKM
jgi:hypothetical protein